MLAAVALMALSGCSTDQVTLDPNPDKPFVLGGVSELTEIAQLTGPGAINDTESVMVAGTDLGSMVNVGDRTLFLFGDTFGERDPDSTGGQGDMWRSNTGAWTTDDDPADGIEFDGWVDDALGIAAPLIEGDHQGNDAGGEVTKIPTYGFTVGSNIYVSYMSVKHWGAAGDWDANYAALIVSHDDGETWEQVEGVQWPGDSDFVQFAAAQVSDGARDWVYLWTIPAGRFGNVHLMRVPATPESVESQAAYEYFAGTDDGDPMWSTELSEAAPVVEGTIGELSVVWSSYLERWLMTYSDGGDAIIREGVTPWGPWGDPLVLVPGDQYDGLYSPYMNPRYVDDDGRRIYFTLSLWGPYNVFWFSAELDRIE
ncbi:hypothetical protein GCM10025768_03670 [Microbacterium pseudoresistens]